MKMGALLQITGTVLLNGALQDISAFTITASVRKDSEKGAVVGSCTVTKPSLGTYVLTFSTASLDTENIYIDTKIIDGSGQVSYTPTVAVSLTTPVTP
jgi:hypothetical protein